MHPFKDHAGREWEIAVHFRTIENVRAACGVDLLDLGVDQTKADADQFRHSLFFRLGSDPVLLANVIYVVCQKQCEAAGVSDEDFGRGLVGDAIHDATIALLEDMIDFFPSPGTRRALRSLLDTMQKTEAAMLQMASGRMDQLEPELARLPEICAAQFGKPRERPASPPGTSRTDNSTGCATES